jgi:hypothetical protein
MALLDPPKVASATTAATIGDVHPSIRMRLRDEVDLDILSAELLAVVDRTMQPPLYRSGSNHRRRRARAEEREQTSRDADMTPCMPCSFGLLPPRSEPCAPPDRTLRVTVTVRWIPLMPGSYGTRVARRREQ